MIPVARHTMPIIFPAKVEREIRRVVGWAEEMQVKCIVAGGFEGDQLTGFLKEKRVPVLVSLNYPEPEKDVHPDFEVPVRVLRYQRHAPKAAGELARAGVKIAFYSDGLKNGSDYLSNLRQAVQEGLAKDAAIRAATLGA